MPYSLWPSAAKTATLCRKYRPSANTWATLWKDNSGDRARLLLMTGSCKHSLHLSWLLHVAQAKNIWLSGKAVRLLREKERKGETERGERWTTGEEEEEEEEEDLCFISVLSRLSCKWRSLILSYTFPLYLCLFIQKLLSVLFSSNASRISSISFLLLLILNCHLLSHLKKKTFCLPLPFHITSSWQVITHFRLL